MSKQHGARQQKRLAKQKARREANRRELARRNSPDPSIRLKHAGDWPIVDCIVPESLSEFGIGNLVIARRVPDGQIACAVFLVDAFCLGIKDAMWKVFGQAEYEAMVRKFEEQSQSVHVTPERFAKLIYRAADFAQSLGFPPHRDFRHAQRLLAGIDASQCPDEFEFGRNGQPFYVRGPKESLEVARVISARVQAQGGVFTVPLRDSEAKALLGHGGDWADDGDDEVDANGL